MFNMALAEIASINNAGVRGRATAFLAKLKPLAPAGAPTLHTVACTDGAILFEWITKSRRIGFSVEADEADDGWFQVSKEMHDCGCGPLAEADLPFLIKWFLGGV